MEDIEEMLKNLWHRHSVKPDAIKVSEQARKAVEDMAHHRPDGGNSHQRRKWRRAWGFK